MTTLLAGAAGDCPGDYQDLVGSVPLRVRSPTDCWHPLGMSRETLSLRLMQVPK